MHPLSLLIRFTILALLSSCASSPTTPTLQFTSTLNSSYYVDSNRGSDFNPGSQALPWKTIQKCLDWVSPGDICQILNGTYNESLTLKTSGTVSLPIILKCETAKSCTVNSGNSITLITGGRIHFYIIDGFRFISNYSPASQLDASLDFGKNIWDGETTKDGGNNSFIVRNCYVEGSVIFYGHNNLVENCELNGNNIWSNGITERMATSHDNVFRNNIVHDYKKRGIWSHQSTDNVTIEANTIYNLGSSGIDCDGAYIALTRCNIRNNIIYNAITVAIELENTFDSVVENNIFHSSETGISVINYNKENESDFHSQNDYKSLVTNTIIRNNVIYNMNQNGLICKAVVGNKFINNTVYDIKVAPGYWGAIGMAVYSGFYCHNWEIKNNIIAQATGAVWYETPPTNLSGFIMDNNFYDVGENEVKFTRVQRDPENWSSWTFDQWKASMRLDTQSLLGDPLFVNAASGDFHLQPNSPACNGGENGTYMGAFPCH
jgi:parallel beta-helix repeat protein